MPSSFVYRMKSLYHFAETPAVDAPFETVIGQPPTCRSTVFVSTANVKKNEADCLDEPTQATAGSGVDDSRFVCVSKAVATESASQETPDNREPDPTGPYLQTRTLSASIGTSV
jgi:hypothetical protein